MNVFVVSRGYPSKTDPQWGNFEVDQARALAEVGHKVIVLSVDVRCSKVKNRLGVTRVVEPSIVSYSLNPGPWVISSLVSNNFYYWIYRVFLLSLYEKVVKTEGTPDIIYAHYQNSSLAALLLKKKYNVPVIGIEHWSALGIANPPRIAIEHGKYTYPSLDKVLVVSNALKENIKKLFNVDSEVVNNIIGKEFCYSEYSNTDGIVHFVLIGNLKPVKCIDLAITAFAKVAQVKDNVRFTIVGDGTEKEKLYKIIKEYGLTDKVQLVGRKDRDYIVNLLQTSDIYVLSSSSETFGVAAGEALACGVPVIATDCGGPRDFMNDFNGLLIPVNDVDALTEAMGYMVDHYKEFDRKRIAQDCHERFSSEAIAKQLTTIFNEVVKK